ncbi:MAG TPA: hypothetical protein VJ904_00010 [Tichowtungia sp.]|nr:hypothetical protein [Tichowtungia sp.]
MREGTGILCGKWEASVSTAKIDGRAVTVRTPRPCDRRKRVKKTGQPMT